MKKILLILTLMVAAISGVRATSIYSDDFTYPSGSLVTNSSFTWIPNSGTGNAATMMIVTNNQLVFSAGRAEDVEREFFPATLFAYPTNDPTLNLYASFQMMVTNLPATNGTYIAHFTGTNAFGGLSGHRARFSITLTNLSGKAPDGTYFASVANSNLGSVTNAPWATPLTTNIFYTVVLRYNTASGASTLWINPNAEGDLSVTATDGVPPGVPDVSGSGQITNGLINIHSFGFRQAAGEGTNNLIDSVKVGTQFADVAGPNTAPSITGIPNQSIPASSSTNLSFTVGDVETPAASLTLSNSTSNPGLIPSSSIVFGGSGANRTVTLTPLTGQQGTATIGIYVSDGVNVTPTSFILTVGAPTISSVSNIITYSNLPPATTTVTVGDAETGAASVTVSNSFTNPGLIASVVVSGSGATRTVTVTPITDQSGVSTVTLYGRDPSANLVQVSFLVVVAPRLGVLLSEPFSYDDFLVGGNFSPIGADLDGATNSPWVHASGAIQGELQLTNGTAVITSSNAEDIAANLANGPYSTTSGVILYTGFTINMQSLSSPLGDYFLHLRDTVSGSTFKDKIYVGRPAGTADGAVRIGIAVVSSTTADVFYPMDCFTNTTYQVVTKYNIATGESVLWVNPVDETSTHVTASDVNTPSSVGAIGLRESDFEGTMHLDNLVVSTAFSDVSPPVAFSSLQIQLIGGNVQVSWSNSGTFFLQAATNVLGPYKYASNGLAPATTPASFPATQPASFYRSINVAP